MIVLAVLLTEMTYVLVLLVHLNVVRALSPSTALAIRHCQSIHHAQSFCLLKRDRNRPSQSVKVFLQHLYCLDFGLQKRRFRRLRVLIDLAEFENGTGRKLKQKVAGFKSDNVYHKSSKLMNFYSQIHRIHNPLACL